MEGTYHLIVRKPYQDIPKEFLMWLSANVDNYLIGQHDADDDVKTTHCHFSFTNLMKTNKALDKQRQKYQLDGDTSRLLKHVVGTRELYDEDKLAIYILKGNREILKSTSYSAEFVDECVETWVEHDKKEDIQSPEKKVKVKYDEFEVMKKDFMHYYHEMNKPMITLDGIRSWTMRWYWKRDGRMPPATSYKRNAASLYVYSKEISGGCLDTAFEELKELWY